jgi:colicin V production protein
MNLVDIFFLLIILVCGLIGLKRGFFKELVLTVGYIILLIISYKLITPTANLIISLVKVGNNPINLLIYQIIAFLVVFIILSIIFQLIVFLTNALEKLLNITIVLGIFSKILGFILGLVKGVIVAYLLSLLFTLPMFNNIPMFRNSTIKSELLTKMPNIKLNQIVNEISKLDINSNDFNKQVLQILIKYNILTKEKVIDMVKSGQLDSTFLNYING